MGCICNTESCSLRGGYVVFINTICREMSGTDSGEGALSFFDRVRRMHCYKSNHLEIG